MSVSDLLHQARRALAIDQLVLAIHDASFPSASGEDIGRGSPLSRGAAELLAFAHGLGFTGIQLGPQGETSRGNRSPYDGTVFGKSVLSIDLPSLVDAPGWEHIFDRARVRAVVRDRPETGTRVHYDYVFDRLRGEIALARSRFARVDSGDSPALRDLRIRYEAFLKENAEWLEHDAAFERATGQLELGDSYAFAQFVIHAQHDDVRAARAHIPLTVYGDLQVGLSMCDRWQRESLFLHGYAMGAPSSRTEPDGQPWGYPVMDPSSAAANRLLELRVAKMLREMDGIRIDHPHGLVCPWVYDATDPDPFHAVKHGARLFESPDLPDHPRLASLAIARPDQIDRRVTRYADGWVTSLDEDQVSLYARRIDDIVHAVRARGGSNAAVVCEVLSTQPLPLGRVLDRHRLGRFRVTQKADPENVHDGYRSENAHPSDWIMPGNHDTLPLLMVVDKWHETGKSTARARYFAGRIGTDAARLEQDPAALAQAIFADLFVGPARNVMIFVPDLLGVRAVYNRPGIVDDVNWTWRVPNDFRAVHASGVARGEALDMPRAMAAALRAKSDATRAMTGLIDALDEVVRERP